MTNSHEKSNSCHLVTLIFQNRNSYSDRKPMLRIIMKIMLNLDEMDSSFVFVCGEKNTVVTEP